jgi:hypothetical protein
MRFRWLKMGFRVWVLQWGLMVCRRGSEYHPKRVEIGFRV